MTSFASSGIFVRMFFNQNSAEIHQQVTKNIYGKYNNIYPKLVLGALLGRFGGHLGPRANKTSIDQACGRHFGTKLSQVGAKLGQVEAKLFQVGVKISQVGFKLGKIRTASEQAAHLGKVGPNLPRFEPNLYQIASICSREAPKKLSKMRCSRALQTCTYWVQTNLGRFSVEVRILVSF